MNFSIPFLFWLIYSFSHILNGRHKCQFCGSSHASRNAMQNHISNYHQQERELKFNCQFCHRLYSSENFLNYHISTKHQQEQNSMQLHISRLKCQFCDKSYATNHSLSGHISAKHRQEQKSVEVFDYHPADLLFSYFCLIFSFPFLFWLSYSFSHILNGRHKCHFCGSSHATKSAMQNHISIYHGQLKCQFCDESYATKLLLQFHINTKHRQEQTSM